MTLRPQYLPDGRIVFTSTRQRQSQAILRDEGKPGFEAQTDDAQRERLRAARDEAPTAPTSTRSPSTRATTCRPSVLADGRVLFSRWDGATRSRHPPLHGQPRRHQPAAAVRRAQPRHRHQRTPTIQFTRPREMQNGRILALVRPFTDTDFGGDLTHDRRRALRREHAAAGRQRRHDGPGADPRHAQRGLDRRGPFARRPLPFGLSAVGRHQPHPGELVAVPPARHHRHAQRHRALHAGAPGRPERCRRPRRCTAPSCSIRPTTPSSRCSSRWKA